MTAARKRRLAAMAIAAVAWWGLPAAAAAQGCGVHCEPGCCGSAKSATAG